MTITTAYSRPIKHKLYQQQQTDLLDVLDIFSHQRFILKLDLEQISGSIISVYLGST